MKVFRRLFHFLGFFLAVLACIPGASLRAQETDTTPDFGIPCESFNQVDFDTPPVMIDSVAVEYPDIAFLGEIEGSLTLKAAVNPDGSLCDILVARPLNPIMNRAAISALKISKFKPAHKNGQPTQGVIFVTYDFVHEKEMARRDALAVDEIRIKTKDELTRMLYRPEAEISRSFAYTFSLLGAGSSDLLINMLNHENYRVRRNAAKGLGYLGTPQAREALTRRIGDLPEESLDWTYLVDALVYIGDQAALPILHELEQRVRAQNRVHADGVLFSIRQIENKDLGRSQLVFSRGFLRFRFLLDEICRIYYLQDPQTFADNGYIYSRDPNSAGKETSFEQADFRKICDLLSDGHTQNIESVRGRSSFLVIELCGGNHVALMRDKDGFIIQGENRDGSANWFSVTSHDLAEFIDQAVANH